MSHMPKVVSLTAALLLFGGGVSLAGPPDPTKPVSAICGVNKPCPDLVPWTKDGGIGVWEFACLDKGNPYSPSDQVLYYDIAIKNIGTAKTTVAVKMFVKVNGAVVPQPGATFASGILPNEKWRVDSVILLPPGPGTYTLWVKVDSDNAVAELNENNNEATATTTCRTARRVEPPKVYPKPKKGPPPVEQQVVPPIKSK